MLFCCAGDVIVGQTLAQAHVPDVFYLTVEATDKAVPPKFARTTLTANIVRNKNIPEFTEVSLETKLIHFVIFF
jgi:hypothetical protein